MTQVKSYSFPITILLLLILFFFVSGCIPKPTSYLLPPTTPVYNFGFVADTQIGSPTPGLRLFSVKQGSKSGQSVANAICYATTLFHIAEGQQNMFAWFREGTFDFEFEAVAYPSLSEPQSNAAQQAAMLPDGRIAAIVPCDMDVVWIRPLSPEFGTKLDISIVASSGISPIIHIRVHGTHGWKKYFRDVLNSSIGILFQVGYRLTGQEDINTAPVILRP